MPSNVRDGHSFGTEIFSVLKRVLLIICFWAGVFFVNLSVLYLFAEYGRGRLSSSLLGLSSAFSNQALVDAFYVEIKGMLYLLGSGAVIFLTVARARDIAICFVCSLPILCTALVGSLQYTSSAADFVQHGVNWPERFVMLWSCLVGGSILALACSADRLGILSQRVKPFVSLVTVAFALWLQAHALEFVREYDVVKTFAVSEKSGRKVLRAARLKRREKRFLECLSEGLPAFTPITTSGYLFAKFHQHDIVPGRSVEGAVEYPKVFVCQNSADFPYSKNCSQSLEKAAQAGYITERVNRLQVGFDKELNTTIDRCIRPRPIG